MNRGRPLNDHTVTYDFALWQDPDHRYPVLYRGVLLRDQDGEKLRAVAAWLLRKKKRRTYLSMQAVDCELPTGE